MGRGLMILHASHTTTYSYSGAVSLCQTEVRLKPRTCGGQHLLEHRVIVDPEPLAVATRTDFFGNELSRFTIDEPHTSLRIAATSVIENNHAEAIHPALTPPWEQVRNAVREHRTCAMFAAFQFTIESPRIPLTRAFADYASASFVANRPILQCAIDLCGRIFADFKYDREATTVTTSVEQALRTRRGVCQDFAHVMIACLRVLGLPARYVSGYLRTGENAVGATGSHAWLAMYCPGFDWLDIDPTNNVIPSADHVTLGWGRDYSDVPPVKGVVLGGGHQTVAVEVRVTGPE